MNDLTCNPSVTVVYNYTSTYIGFRRRRLYANSHILVIYSST